MEEWALTGLSSKGRVKVFQKIGFVFLTALLLMPGALVSAHIFADHQHVYCDHHSEEHLHQKVVDCDIFNLQQHGFLGVDLLQFEPFVPEEQFSPVNSEYHFLIGHFSASTSLRGPPMEV